MIRRLMWTAHWLAVATTATAAEIAAPLPFTGQTAGAIGILAATAVACIGYACAPHPATHTNRKEPRP